MVWHIWSFAFVVITGVLVCIVTHATFHHPGWFYFCYYLLLVCIFFTELPFIYILNNVINQALHKTRKSEVDKSMNKDSVVSALQTNLNPTMIEIDHSQIVE